MATKNESNSTRGANARATAPIARLTGFALALALVCGAGPVLAQGIPVTDNTATCPGFRFLPGTLGCTANDGATNAVFTPVVVGGTCIAGDLVAVNVNITLESTTGAARDDYAFFAGTQGNNPTGVTAGEICSATTISTTSPAPFVNPDGDSCANLPGNTSATTSASGLMVLCDPNADGSLEVPFALTYTQSATDVCTGPNDSVAGTPSKCFAGVGIVQGLAVNGFVNVTKVTVDGAGTPVSSPQDFAFTASGDATPTPTSFTLDTDAGDATFTNTQQVQMAVIEGTTRTLNIDEAVTPGFMVTNIQCTAANGSALPTQNHDIANGIISVELDDVAFGANCTITNGPPPLADLDLSKTLNEAGPFLVGDTVTFDIVVSNNGPDAATSVVVTDTVQNVTITNVVSVPAGCTAFPCNIASIASGGSVTITVTGTIDNATPGQDGLIDFGNSAQAASPVSPDSPTDGDFDKAEPQNPALTLDKTTTTVGYDSVGDTISYGYAVTNSGNIPFAGDVSILDDKATVTCPTGPLAVGATINCTASYTITQADLDAGSVTNIATASSNGTTSNSDTVTVTGTQTQTVSLDKTAMPATYTTAGQTITYMYVVTNTGNVTLTGPATVVDDKATVTCPAGNLAPGGFVTCMATYTITQADVNAGSVTNVATATVDGTASNQDTATVTAVQSTGLLLDKTFDLPYNAVGQTITYSYLVTNTGNVSLAGPVTVADNKATVTCPALTTVGNNDGSLDPGESITCTAAYVTTQADLDLGTVTNTATATVGGVNSNPDTVVVPASGLRGVSLILNKTTTTPTYSAVGQVISYSYRVDNLGDTTVVGPVTIADNRTTVTCPAGSIAPNGFITCTATYVITQADLNNGSVTNTAIASANGNLSNVDQVTVTGLGTAGLSLDKTASSAGYSVLGQTITYSYLVTNTGNVALAGPVTVADNRIASVTCPAGGLAPGASTTCTATYNITQADLDNDSVTNTATASSNGTTSNTDTVTILDVSITPTIITAVPVPVDSRWVLIALALLLGFGAQRRLAARRRG